MKQEMVNRPSDSSENEPTRCAHRLARLPAALCVDDPNAYLSTIRTLVGITSSRLGHDAATHQIVGRFLCRAVLDARKRNAILLIVHGSAIELWAVRAAELFGVDWVHLLIAGEKSHPCHSHTTTKMIGKITVTAFDGGDPQRDEVLVLLADRLEAVHVRRGGRIAQAIAARLIDPPSHHPIASVRVALFGHSRCGALELVQAGAIGWYSPVQQPTEPQSSQPRLTKDQSPVCWQTKNLHDHWVRQPQRWLIHCTRSVRGPWPGQTESQYRDEVLIGNRKTGMRTPQESLDRILRSGRLLASSIATAKSHPVVCFTERSLMEILSMRCFRPHLARWDYEPYGIAIEQEVAISIGIRPVIYGQPSERRTISEEDRFRFHPIGKTFDWRSEKEWRSPANVVLDQLPVESVHLFAPDSCEDRTALERSPFSVTWLVPEVPPSASEATKNR